MSPTQFYNALHRMLDGYANAQEQVQHAIELGLARYSFQQSLDIYQSKERDVAQFMLKNRNMLPPSTLEEYDPK